MSDQLYTVGVPMTGGYFTAEIDADSEHDALNLIKSAIEDGAPLYGVLTMPRSPSHKSAPMIINPAHVLGYVRTG